MLIHAAEIPEIIYLFFKSEKLSFVEYECHLRFSRIWHKSNLLE